MGRGEYTSIGAERGERGDRGGRHRGGGERGDRRGHRSWGRNWGGGGWPYYGYGLPSYGYAVPSYGYGYAAPSYGYGYAAPSYGYGYALPAYDITDSGYVYNTGQHYAPSYGPSGPYYAQPLYGAATAFPHWRSPRHFLHRHRRRIRHLIGQEVD